MSKKDILLDDFITLRIQGLSFQAIADKLNVTKQTLLEWNKEFKVRDEIALGRIFKTNELLKAYEMDRDNRLKNLLLYKHKLYAELQTRKLEDIPTSKLYEMLLTVEERIINSTSNNIQVGKNPSNYEIDKDDGFFIFEADE